MNLLPNEKIIFSAKVSPYIFLPATITFMSTIFFIILAITTKKTEILWSMIILAIMFFFLSIRLTIEAAIMMATTKFKVTNKRIIAKTGFIHQNTIEILLPKIEGVKIYQNILGKLLNFGDVTITGTGGTKETFKAIIDPEKVRTKVNQIIEHYSQAQP